MSVWTELTDSFQREQQIEEMNKKYNGCILFITSKHGGTVPAKYNGFSDGYHRFLDVTSMNIVVAHDTNVVVSCGFPEVGLFNLDCRMGYFYRKPARQYKRGPCKDNCGIFDPVLQLWTARELFSITAFAKAFETRYPSLFDAHLMLQNKERCSVAISRDFGISMSITDNPNFVFLWYHDTCIGTVDFNLGLVEVRNKYFDAEVIDHKEIFKPLDVVFKFVN